MNQSVARYAYNGPRQPVLEVTAAVMAEGAILPIVPPAPNATWELSILDHRLSANMWTGQHVCSSGRTLLSALRSQTVTPFQDI